MTLLYGILPPVMAWQLRRKAQADQPSSAASAASEQPSDAAGHADVVAPWWRRPSPADVPQPQSAAAGGFRQQAMVPGGPVMLASLFSAAVAIEVSRLAADAGQLATAGGEAGLVQVGFRGWLAATLTDNIS
jgi:hypothetical protein